MLRGREARALRTTLAPCESPSPSAIRNDGPPTKDPLGCGHCEPDPIAEQLDNAGGHETVRRQEETLLSEEVGQGRRKDEAGDERIERMEQVGERESVGWLGGVSGGRGWRGAAENRPEVGGGGGGENLGRL